MSPERRENSHDRAKVVEQLRTPWGPLNKRTSQGVLEAIGRETGLFQVPRIISCDEAIKLTKLINETKKQALKGKQVMGAWELQYPLMRSYLHSPLADNLLCGYLPTYELQTHYVDSMYYDLCEELVKQQVEASVYIEQMGFPAEGLDKFGVFFQEQIGGDNTEKVVVLDTADGAYVEVVPVLHPYRWKKRGFLFTGDKLGCSMSADREYETVEAGYAKVAREASLRHLTIKDRFYRGKPLDGRFPLVSEWVHRSASDKDEFYAVQLRASLVKRPYVFNVIKMGNGELADKWDQTIRIHFNWPIDTINVILGEAQGYSFYVLGTPDDQLPFGVRYGQPVEMLVNHEKAATLMDHNLFSIVQAVHSLGGRITIVDLGRGGVKYYDQRA